MNKQKRIDIWVKTKGHCAYCGKYFGIDEKWEIEHIIPKSRGGGNNIDNYFLSCKKCNAKKKDMTPDEYKRHIAQKIYSKFWEGFDFYGGEYFFDKYFRQEDGLNAILEMSKTLNRLFGEDMFHFYFENMNKEF